MTEHYKHRWRAVKVSSEPDAYPDLGYGPINGLPRRLWPEIGNTWPKWALNEPWAELCRIIEVGNRFEHVTADAIYDRMQAGERPTALEIRRILAVIQGMVNGGYPT